MYKSSGAVLSVTDSLKFDKQILVRLDIQKEFSGVESGVQVSSMVKLGLSALYFLGSG